MVHRNLFLVVLFCGLTAGCSRQLPPGERNNFHPFGVRHAWLHLEYLGDTRGWEDIYEDSSGFLEAHLVHSEIAVKDQFHSTITYTVRRGSSVTVVDSVQQKEIRLLDRISDSLYHLPNGDVPTPDDQFGSYFGQQGYIVRGDTTIVAGNMSLKSHIWQVGQQQNYIFEFQGFIVGSKSNIEGHENDLRLISMDTTSLLDPAWFSPSHGFPVVDMTKGMPTAPGPQQ